MRGATRVSACARSATRWATRSERRTRIVGDLADAGYVSRERHGRRNRYTINAHLTLPDPVARRQRVGDLLAVLTEAGSAPISQAGRP